MACAAVLAAFALSAHAQDALLQNAQSLIAGKQAAQAYQLLSAQEPQRAGQPEFDYLLGLAALDSGRVTQAIFALERVLAVQPGNSLARAELARAYLAAGETDTARSQLMQVKAAPDVPPQARASVERLLSSIDSDAPAKPLRFYVEAGLGHDSNLSGGPNLTSFAVPGFVIPFQLSVASKQRGDNTLQLGAGLAWTQAISNATEINAQLNLRSTRPFKEDTLDSRSIDGAIGLSHTVDATRYSFSLQLANLNFDGNTYRQTTGLTAQAIHKLNANNQLMGFAQLAQLDYPTQGLRDARRSVLGGAWGTVLSPASSTYLGFALGGEKASQAAGAEFGYRLTGLRAGGEHVLSPQMRLFANLGLEWRKHRANDTFFLDKRSDRQIDLTVGMHVQLPPSSYGQWRITPQLSWTDRSSNIVIYEMRRTQVGVTARLDF